MGRSKVGAAGRRLAYKLARVKRARRVQQRIDDRKDHAQLLLNAVNLRAAAIRASQQAQTPPMAPHHPSTAATHAGPTQSLSNFMYYKKDGGAVNVDIRMGSLLTEHCDAIAFTVNESLSLHAPLPKKVLSKTGNDVKKDLTRLKKSRYFTSGEVAAVDLNTENANGWKTILFVVSPFEPTLTNAYANILTESAARGLESVAIVGLGCGQLGISAKTSAKSLMEALTAFEGESLKSIAILDVQLHVIEGFISRLRELVEENSYRKENREKLVFVSGDVLIDYEARRLTETVSQDSISTDDCVVCLCPLKEDEEEKSEVVALKCSHQFHFDCFKGYLKGCQTRKCCPVCRKYFAVPCGNQPHGSTMRIGRMQNFRLQGHEDVSSHSICIDYNVPGGIQDETHLRPGLPFRGTRRVAFLPESEEGMKVLRLLKKAFECRLIFTVGDSVTTGSKNVVTWNSIHHKTSPDGGPLRFGYPDDTYFVRVRAELEEAGITEDLLSDEDADLQISEAPSFF